MWGNSQYKVQGNNWSSACQGSVGDWAAQPQGYATNCGCNSGFGVAPWPAADAGYAAPVYPPGYCGGKKHKKPKLRCKVRGGKIRCKPRKRDRKWIEAMNEGGNPCWEDCDCDYIKQKCKRKGCNLKCKNSSFSSSEYTTDEEFDNIKHLKFCKPLNCDSSSSCSSSSSSSCCSSSSSSSCCSSSSSSSCSSSSSSSCCSSSSSSCDDRSYSHCGKRSERYLFKKRRNGKVKGKRLVRRNFAF